VDHQLAAWGGYSRQIAPYTDAGLHEVLATPLGRELVAIVDPLQYRERLDRAKLIVIGTNDPYWPLDALNLYWDELPEPKAALYLPNVGHSADDFARLLPALVALHRHAGAGSVLPRPEWEFEIGDGTLRLLVRPTAEAPTVTAWSASAPTRDFREARWSSSRCDRDGDRYRCEIPLPESGFSALFAEVIAPLGELTFPVSTGVRIVPD
jgi:PhoPQ-activated pathogenicity-related protein